MDILTEFPLQPLVEAYNCRYFVDNAVADCETLNLAIRSPFAKLYCLSRRPSETDATRWRFQGNDRITIFNWTHEESWDEVVRLIPYDAPAVFWMHESENIGRGLTIVARLRPAKRDVIVVEPGSQRGVRGLCDRLFGRTHAWHHTTGFAHSIVPKADR